MVPVAYLITLPYFELTVRQDVQQSHADKGISC